MGSVTPRNSASAGRRTQQTAILLFVAVMAWLMGTAWWGACWLMALAAAYTLPDAVRWVRIVVACAALFAFPLMLMGNLLGGSVEW